MAVLDFLNFLACALIGVCLGYQWRKRNHSALGEIARPVDLAIRQPIAKPGHSTPFHELRDALVASEWAATSIPAGPTIARDADDQSLLLGKVRTESQCRDDYTQMEAELGRARSIIAKQKRELVLSKAEARTDDLTDLFNRRAMNDWLDHCLKRYRMNGEAYSLMLVDIDDFKLINDDFGHVEGDRVLRQVAEVLGASLKTPHQLARYGGDEFSFVLPAADICVAQMSGMQLLKSLAKHRFVVNNQVRHVTVTIGIAEQTEEIDKLELIKRADECLIAAKSGGKNRCCYYDHVIGFPITALPAVFSVDCL